MQRLFIAVVSFVAIQLVFKPVELLAQNKLNQADAVYAAPGMMVKVSRPPNNNIAVKPKSKPALVLSSVVLDRFWNDADTAKARNYAAFIRELYSHIKYPPSSLRDQVEGTFYLQLTVGADGLVSDVALEKKDLVWVGESNDESQKALEEEALKAAKRLRFKMSSTQSDIIAVPVKFVIQ